MPLSDQLCQAIGGQRELESPTDLSLGALES
jgi:hypothetical protein